jgi:hypothetical protein
MQGCIDIEELSTLSDRGVPFMNQSRVEGGCLCGAVRYRVDEDPIASAMCHCRTCRKAVSAPILPFITFPTERLTFTRGTAKDFHSSPGVTRSFCGQCGSALTYRSDKDPEHIDVMTCSLDNPEAFPPTHHVWVSHKLGWESIGDGLPAHQTSMPT